jgi:hypothetical protein
MNLLIVIRLVFPTQFNYLGLRRLSTTSILMDTMNQQGFKRLMFLIFPFAVRFFAKEVPFIFQNIDDICLIDKPLHASTFSDDIEA